MKIPFGKYKGEEIEDLPSSYLLWLAENIDDEEKGSMSICLQADEEWRHREDMRSHFED